MKMRSRPGLSALAWPAFAALVIGCGDNGGREEGTATATVTNSGGSLSQSGSDGSEGSSGPATPTTSGATSSDTTIDPSSTGGGPDGVLTIDPAMPVITIENGVAPPLQLTAKLNGAPVAATWSGEATFLAKVDDQGLVTASGGYGGHYAVEAGHDSLSAQADVEVFLKQTTVVGDITDADKLLLDGAVNPDPAALLAYPYDGMVYPTGLPAPELMWNGSTAGDKYLIHYQHELLDVKIYTTAEPPSRYLIDQPLWDAMAKTVAGGQLKLRVHRLVLGQPTATVVTDDTWTISKEPLIGSVYYWANSLGRVLRINPGASAPEDFLAAGGQDGCSTCHSVSANGHTLILGGDIAVSNWDLVTNTSKLDITSVGKPVRNWAMAAISADGSVVVENGELNLPGPPGGGDGMWDAATGMKLANTGLEGVTLNMPAFSANGKKLAYIDHTTLALGVRDYDAALKAATNPVELVPAGADPTLNGITFPSMMPDGSWITYHRGAYPACLDTRNGPGHLYLASTTMPGVEIRLSNANGDTYPFVAGDRDRGWNYEPTFAPRNSGGYAWAVFTSRRTYGNRSVGGTPEVKQLWMMAIDANPQPGVDPSHMPFWMPGQDVTTLNMRGFWALEKDDPGG